MNHNLNLNTLLPKLATIIPLLGIGLNLILHLIRTGSLVSFDWQWCRTACIRLYSTSLSQAC